MSTIEKPRGEITFTNTSATNKRSTNNQLNLWKKKALIAVFHKHLEKKWMQTNKKEIQELKIHPGEK